MKEILALHVLEFFFENTHGEVYLRELARRVKLSPFAVKKYMEFFLKKGLIVEERIANLRYFKANRSSLVFKHLKVSWNINKIVESGLIDYLVSVSQNVSSVVLFGSVAVGNDDKNSDIDLVVIGKNENLNISKFRSKLKKEVNLHVFGWSEWKKQVKTNKAFYSDVIVHGIALHGELPLIN